ncbi:hypothetical protein VB713_24190 [Anabaena cylindrica UHCC 0172]|uniref:hypothetical protein n=1 Tax=Anabaena cylindrica TaxID=1165 RepID=UPI002B1F431E|nr:hypothetical protein [Anabaena cylindrica]MEA5554042.1 hypothetical protein [Anabaena cylindrica UHCC 0172]
MSNLNENVNNMDMLEEIRRRATQPTVPTRQDVLLQTQPITPDTQIEENSTVNNQGSELKQLAEKLASFPEISPRIPVRLEVPIKEELDQLCAQEKITIETLLEAFYITCKDKDPVMKQVLKEAKKRLRNRKEAGNIRSSITRLTNLTNLTKKQK